MKYELIDHGIDHAQYFQGCATAYTNFDHVVTGCGSNFSEALDDALEIIAQDEASDVIQDIEAGLVADGVDFKATVPNTDRYYEENEDSEMYYYVSIRYNLDKVAT